MTVYLIHIHPPVGRASHYLGLCKDDRLEARLHEHALGGGAALTREAIKRGSKLYLARTWEGADHVAERSMKTHKGFAAACPLCCPLLKNLRGATYEIDTSRPDQPPPRAVLDWRTQSSPTRSPK